MPIDMPSQIKKYAIGSDWPKTRTGSIAGKQNTMQSTELIRNGPTLIKNDVVNSLGGSWTT